MLRLLSIAALLVAATAAVYAQTPSFEFIYYDDLRYVTQNQRVQQGLTLENLLWSFSWDSRGAGVGMWHPLTWLSLMLDQELFGLDAAGYHRTNALLHALDVAILFAVLRALTGAVWRSALVAALFAVHPLNVEVVALVQQRKDVLSAGFGLLSIGAYASFARRGGAGRYLACGALLAAGLCAKPTLVTFPLLFLLLDYWPLGRLRALRAEAAAAPARGCTPARLVLEKLPLLAICLAASVVNWAFQPIVPDAALAFQDRVANAVVAYAQYLERALWPHALALLHPHPYLPLAGGTRLPAWQIAASAALLLALTAAALREAHRGYPIVGWLWFLGTLFPTIGIVQVGIQGLAWRYAYLPMIGVYVVAAWGACDGVRAAERRAGLVRGLAIASGVCALAVLGVAARSHAARFRDSITLFEYTLAVAPRNPLIHYNLGNVLKSKGETEAAIEHYRRALEVNPQHTKARINLANTLAASNRERARSASAEAAPAAASANARPHVLLVSVDTLRADRLSSYGYSQATSPNLDRIAAQGVLFERALAASSRTSPSHASILTSRFARQHTVGFSNGDTRLEDATTLAERFRGAGYATAAFVSNPMLQRRLGFDRGFDVYDDAVPSAERNRAWAFERVAEDTTRRALAWLAEQRERPVFLFVHYQDPHGPYAAPAPFAERLRLAPRPGEPILRLLPNDTGQGGIPAYQALPGLLRPSEYESRYDGEILYADHWTGALVGALDAHSPARPAVVLFTADHGEAFGEFDRWFVHGHTSTPEVAHVPFVLRAPGLAPGRRAEPVHHVDVLPTLLELAGLPAPESRGIALGPYLREGRALPARSLFCDVGSELSVYAGERFARVSGLARWTGPGGALESVTYAWRRDGSFEPSAPDPALLAPVEPYLAAAVPMRPAPSIAAEERKRLEALGYVLEK